MLPKLAGIPELGRDLLPTDILRPLSFNNHYSRIFGCTRSLLLCVGSPFVAPGGCSVAMRGLLVAVASLVVEHGL